MLTKKAQLAYEFLLLFFFLTVFFTTITIMIAEGRENVQWDKTALQFEDAGLEIQHEFYTVANMPNGFSKNITLPPLINNNPYTINIHADGQYYLVLTGLEGEMIYTYDLPVFVAREPIQRQPYTNSLSKEDGILYLN